MLDRISDEEVEEQEEEVEEQEDEVDRAPKRMHASEDGDVQKCAAQIAKVKVADIAPCDP